MSKAIVIGYLAKVSAANVNASHTEGNVVVAKKSHLARWNYCALHLWTGNPANVARPIGRVGLSAL